MEALKGIGPAGPLVPWYKRAGVWIGIATGPGAFVVGGGLAANLPLAALIPAIPIGALILSSVTVAEGIVARRRRQTLARRAASTFGSGLGAGLLNFAMAFGTLGWVSFYLGIAGFSLAKLLNLPGWSGPLILVSSSVVLNELGLNRWNALVWVTTISALSAAIVALVIVEPQPAEAVPGSSGLAGLFWGIGSVVSYSTVFAVRCGDFTWDLETDADVIKDGLTMFVPLMMALSIGVMLYQTTGGWNLADVLARTPSAALGHIFLILSVIGPIQSNFHSGALAIEGLVSLKRRLGVLLMSTIGFFLGATRFDHQLIPFLDLLGAILPPALAVLLATALIRQKVPASTALLAWLAGSGAALVFKFQGQLIHLAVGAAVSLVVLHIMLRLSKSFELSDA
jgi:hypothetical protein